MLKEYARRYEADTSGWKFLTGSSPKILAVTFQYGVDYYGESGGEINHLVATYIIDQAGSVARVLRSCQEITFRLYSTAGQASSDTQ